MEHILTALVSVVATLTSAKAWDYYSKKLQGTTTVLNRKDTELAEWRKELKERVAHLENQVASLLKENATLTAQVHGLQGVVATLREENDKLHADSQKIVGATKTRRRAPNTGNGGNNAPVEVRQRKPRRSQQ